MLSLPRGWVVAHGPRVLPNWLLSSQVCLPLEHCCLWGQTEGSGAGRGSVGLRLEMTAAWGAAAAPRVSSGFLSGLIV